MPVSINASPTKVYIFLFLFVVIGYGVVIINRSLKRSDKDMEHFVEQNPEYKYRLEVMKVFDLYMNRNPTPEEINKYAGIQNEQDILLTILKDFNITASDVNKEKLAKWAVGVEEEFSEPVEQVAPNAPISTLPPILDKAIASTADIDIDKIVAASRKKAGYPLDMDTWVEKPMEDKVTVPVKVYEELQSKVTELHNIINRLKPE